MSKKVYLFSLFMLTLFLASCSETKEAGKYDDWGARNDAYIDNLAHVYATAADKGGLSQFKVTSSAMDVIYYRVKTAVVTEELNKKVEGKRPVSGATVKLFYKGTNILGEQFDGNFVGADPIAGNPDASKGDSNPTSFALSNVLVGWQEAIQQMKVGERWEIYLPAAYAYGSTEKSALVPAYSALIFDIQLLDASTVAEK